MNSLMYNWAEVKKTLGRVREQIAAYRSGDAAAVEKVRADLAGREPIVRFLCDLAGDAATTVDKITDEEAKEAFDRRQGCAPLSILDLIEHGSLGGGGTPH